MSPGAFRRPGPNRQGNRGAGLDFIGQVTSERLTNKLVVSLELRILLLQQVLGFLECNHEFRRMDIRCGEGLGLGL